MTKQLGHMGTINRRDLLKLGLASGVALVLVDTVGDHSVQADTTYYGVDSYTPSYSGYDLDFYIGRGGGPTLPNDDYFHYGRAQDIYSRWESYYRCHIYWRLYGPGACPPVYSDYQWGYYQATQACNAWYNADWAAYVWGRTFFADIEEYDGAGGWLGDQGRNRQVVQGWIDGVYDYTHNGSATDFVPGIYTRPDLWESWFGTAYRTPRSATTWICNCRTLWGTDPKPCSNPSGARSYAATNLPAVKETVFGGNKVVVWQFFIGAYDSDCYGDFDAAIQSGDIKFTPVTGSRAYNYSC